MTEPTVEVRGLAIEGEVWLDAPIERVFEALTTPEWLCAWWGDELSYRSQQWQIAPVAGTPWHCELVTRRGERHSLGGEVLHVQRPNRLTLSWQASWQPQLCTEVSFELAERAGRTLLALRHTGFRPDFTGLTTHAAGWPWVMAWLAHWLDETSPEATR